MYVELYVEMNFWDHYFADQKWNNSNIEVSPICINSMWTGRLKIKIDKKNKTTDIEVTISVIIILTY